MRTPSLTVALICAGVLLSGCGGDDEDSAGTATTGPTATFTAIASPSPSATPTSKPTPDASIGPVTTVAKYADAYCQAVKDNSEAALQISAARARLEKPGGRSAATLKRYLVAKLDGFRADVLENVNNLRRAGSPRIDDGQELATAIRRSYDYVDLVDKALADVAAIEDRKAADFAKAARAIVVTLQNDMDERLLKATQGAPESDAFTDATIESKICPRSL